MPHTSVILRCPDALYAWYEEQITEGTVEEAMLHVLSTYERAQASIHADDAQRRVVIARRLGSIFGEMLSPLPSPPDPPPGPTPVLPVTRKGMGTKYRKKQHRRGVRR